MKISQYNGRTVLHVDGGGQAHSGVIVGESDDGALLYVQSDRPAAPPALWHFSVKAEYLPILLRNAQVMQ